MMPRTLAGVESAAAALEPLLGESVTVLVKASRVMSLDRLVSALAEAGDGQGAPRC